MKFKNRNGSIKIFIIPLIILTLIFVVTLIAMRINVEKFFYDLKKQESLDLANNISINLDITGSMTDTANRILEENLITALKATTLNSDRFSQDQLGDLADVFEIDEMYVYNSEGVIEYSYSGNYLDWEPYVGHTVYNFMQGDDEIYIENIRKDSESDLYYKYGYIKLENGGLVQIGILADNIQAMLESFELQHHLEQMLADDSMINLFSIDRNYRITASSNKDLIGRRIHDDNIRPVIYHEKIYDHIIETEDGEIYEIYLPLEYESDIISAFGIQYSMDDIKPVVRGNTLIGVVGLGAIYISLVFAIYTTYKRNKQLLELAFFDDKTGLPNRESLKDRLEKDLAYNTNNKAIVMIECDRLSLINIVFFLKS